MQDGFSSPGGMTTVLVAEIRAAHSPGARPTPESLAAVTRIVRHSEERVAQAHGRVLRRIGGSILAAFDSAEHAINAAVAIQQDAGDGSSSGSVGVQIGICRGALSVDGADVLADAVNDVTALAAIAGSGEIFLSEDTRAALPETMLPGTRLIREGSAASSAYEYVWRQGDMTMRPFSFQRSSAFSLEVTFGDLTFELGPGRSKLTLGRSRDCDIVIDEHYASRHHAEIVARGDKFYLLDRSTNGTMVRADGGDMIVVRREEVVLSGVGAIHLGSTSTTPIRYRARGI